MGVKEPRRAWLRPPELCQARPWPQGCFLPVLLGRWLGERESHQLQPSLTVTQGDLLIEVCTIWEGSCASPGLEALPQKRRWARSQHLWGATSSHGCWTEGKRRVSPAPGTHPPVSTQR